jgi:hypothetical protein
MKRPRRIGFLMRERGAYNLETGKGPSLPKQTAPPKTSVLPRLVRPASSGIMPIRR